METMKQMQEEELEKIAGGFGIDHYGLVKEFHALGDKLTALCRRYEGSSKSEIKTSVQILENMISVCNRVDMPTFDLDAEVSKLKELCRTIPDTPIQNEAKSAVEYMLSCIF